MATAAGLAGESTVLSALYGSVMETKAGREEGPSAWLVSLRAWGH